MKIENLSWHVSKEEGRAPMLFLVYEGEGRNIMLYGHLDKQPHMEGWDANKGPTEPVIEGG